MLAYYAQQNKIIELKLAISDYFTNPVTELAAREAAENMTAEHRKRMHDALPTLTADDWGVQPATFVPKQEYNEYPEGYDYSKIASKISSDGLCERRYELLLDFFSNPSWINKDKRILRMVAQGILYACKYAQESNLPKLAAMINLVHEHALWDSRTKLSEIHLPCFKLSVNRLIVSGCHRMIKISH